MKNQMIIATRYGLKRFERSNDFWEKRDHALSGLEITSLDMQADVGLAGTTEGVYVTRDAGLNLELESAGMQTPHVRWVGIHPQDNRYWFAGT